MNTGVRLALVVLFALPTIVGGASAQAGGFRLNAYRTPALASDGLLRARPATLQASQWSVGARFDYANDPLVLELEGGAKETEYSKIVDNQLHGHLAVAYGAIDKLSMFGVLNVVLIEDGNKTPMPNMARRVLLADGPGLGDARLGARYRFVGGGARDRGGLAAEAAVIVPLAELSDESQNFRGEAGVAGDLALLGDVDLKFLRLGASAGVRVRKQIQFIESKIGNELMLGLGASVPLGSEAIEGLVELQASTMLADAFAKSSSPTELLVGMRASALSGWRFTLGGGPGLQRGLGAPDFRVLAGATFVSTVKSQPETEYSEDTFERDVDGDEVMDTADRCPMDAEDSDGFQDEDGCPDGDNDADSVMDAADQCPSEAEDQDGFADQDGCPESDNDADGVVDGFDKCPNQAEDKLGPDDHDGCPHADGDGDGVPDSDDKCPTVRGEPAEQGCSAQVSLDQGQIKIAERVEFGLGQADLIASSDLVLEAVKGVLETNPKLTKVMIQGHTDGRGATKNNLDLSKRRAATVAAWLTQRGIAADRLAAWGCGEARPIVDDSTIAGQQQNRRVEFHVVETDSAAAPSMQGCEPAQ